MSRLHRCLTALCACLLFVPLSLQAQDVCVYQPPGATAADVSLLKPRLLKQVQSLGVAPPATPLSKGPITGTWNLLVILIDFPDYPWDETGDPNFFNDSLAYTPSYFGDMLFSLNSFADPFSSSDYTGSMRDYYLENSYGQFDIRGVVTRWYRAEHNLSYYTNPDGNPNTGDEYGFGTYPNNAQRLVEEAVAAADSTVDFALFDNDGDGWVESLFVVHAGPSAEELYTINYDAHWNYLWSHKSAIQTQRRDGVWLFGYTLEPENGRIGVFSHEFGHVLGLPDYYDTDNSSEGIGEWGLMASGGWCHSPGDRVGTGPAHFSAYSKKQLGWLQPRWVTASMDDVEIPPVEVEPVAYRLWRDGAEGPEYFLLENRQTIGFDRGLTRRQVELGLQPAAGLLIYHIDEEARQANDRHRQIDVEEASPWFETDGGLVLEQLDLRRDLTKYQFLNQGNRGDNGDPWPGYSRFAAELTDFVGARDRTVFDDSTVPSARDYLGEPTGVRVANIRLVGLAVRADLIVPGPTEVVQAPSSAAIPEQFSLSTPYPNPMGRTGHIDLGIPSRPRPGLVEVAVYDILGRRVRLLLHRVMAPGVTRLAWDGLDESGVPLPNGIYFYQATAGQTRITRKLLLVR